MRPHAGEPRQSVLKLRQLHLHLGLGAARPRGKDVENQLGPVDDALPDGILDVLCLRGRQLVVEDDQRRLGFLDAPAKLVDFAGAEVRRRTWPIEQLGDLTHDHGACRVGQPFQLLEMLAEIRACATPLERCSHEERALDRLLNLDRVFCDLGLRLSRHSSEIA